MKPGSRSQIAAHDREAAELLEQHEHQRTVEREQAAQRKAELDAAAPRDLDSLKPGDSIRDRWGWHRVVRVNGKSVSVHTPIERIPFERIIETRSAAEEATGGC